MNMYLYAIEVLKKQHDRNKEGIEFILKTELTDTQKFKAIQKLEVRNNEIEDAIHFLNH